MSTAITLYGRQELASPLHLVGDHSIVGHDDAVLTMADFEGYGIVAHNGSLEIENCTFDAQNLPGISRLISCGATDAKIRIRNCRFRNMASATFASALSVSEHQLQTVEIRNCKFENITSQANGIIGDTSGAARAIYLQCGADNVVIDNCSFDGINSKNASGENVQEDGDAIQTTGSQWPMKTLRISGCRFTNCGKRATKIQNASNAIIEKCRVESAWEFGGNDGMHNVFALIDVDSGTLRDCEAIGGPMRFLVSMSGERVTAVNCTMQPNQHQEYVRGTRTAFCYADATNVSVDNCSAANVTNFLNQGISNRRYRVTGSQLAASSHFANIARAGTKQLIAHNSLVTSGSGTYITHAVDGFDCVSLLNNHVQGFTRGVHVGTQSSNSFSVIATGNIGFPAGEEIHDQSAQPQPKIVCSHNLE
jgi:hypothetical protein